MQARNKTTKLGFALALVILASISLAGYLNTGRLLETSRWVKHTHRVLELLSGAHLHLTDAETGQRGYVITGDRAYLQPYDAAVGVVHREIDELHALTTDNHRQQERASVLQRLVEERLKMLKLGIDLRDKEGVESAQRLILSGEGKELMDGIRDLMGEIGREEKALLESRQNAEAAGTRNMVVTLALGSVVAFALLFWVYRLLTREIAETRRLVEERDRFFNLSLDMLCIAGFDGYFKRLNPAWERTLGFSNEELMSKPFMEFVHPDDRPSTIAKSQEVNQGGQAISFENRYLCKDGSYRWLSWNAKPSTDLQRIFAAARDVTAQKQTHLEIQQLNQSLREQTIQLEAANKELEAFAYSVSHDLRAPLRGIDGFSQALLEDCHDKLDETHKGYLQRVRAASQRMALLIDDLLKLSRVTRSEMQRGTVDLSAMVREIAMELQKSQDGRQVRFAVKDGLVANGDARLLRVALDNLLGNAWKFTSKRSGAEIEFGSVAHNGSAAFFVRDNGAGFDMAYAGKLFGPFQRLHSAHEFDGTGIGLATVQRVVHRHGGKIWAEGAVEKGATFYFTL